MEKRTVVLNNRQGKRISIVLRPFQAGDEAGIIGCVMDEYGDTYFKRDFYDASYVRKAAEKGTIRFLIAENEAGEIAGMMILKQFYPQESMCEIASQIFHKRYRGYGLAMPFFEYGMEILLQGKYSAAYCLPVLFHDITQRLLYRLGMRATGVFLNVFDMEKITHSYGKDRNQKHSQGIQIRVVEKQNAGKLYIPAEHQGFCAHIYESLGVVFQMEAKAAGTGMPPFSRLTYRQDSMQSSLEIVVDGVGQNLAERIRALHCQYPLCGRQTCNILLNCNDENAIYAYGILEELGYFFTGLKPLCSEREYMVLHHSGEMEIYFEDYKVSEEFEDLLAYVKACYEHRKGGMDEKT